MNLFERVRKTIRNVTWQEMKTWTVLQLLFFYIFLVSGLIINFFMLLTYIIFWKISKDLYRKIIVRLAWSSWSQMAFLAQWWSESDVTFFFDKARDAGSIGRENTLVLMNHKYDIDWLITWIIAERLRMLSTTKVFVKNSLRYVPLFGWAWLFTESIFLKRNWDRDRKVIQRDLQCYSEYPPGYPITLLMFCEGTRFSEKKLEKSNEYAVKNGLTPLKHHLIPRTKGFVLTMSGIHDKFDAVWDFTIGFRKDGFAPTLQNVCDGKSTQAEIFGRRIPMKDIPRGSDEEVAQWLHKCFLEKDEIFDHFHKNGQFKIGHEVHLKKTHNDLINYICWTVLLTVPLIKIFWNIAIYGSIKAKLVYAIAFIIIWLTFRLMTGVGTTGKRSEYAEYKKSIDKRNNDKSSNMQVQSTDTSGKKKKE